VPRADARALGDWFEGSLALGGLVDRQRYLIVPASDDAELRFRTETLEKVLRQARLQGERIEPAELPLLRTLTWDPRATEARPAPESIEEGWTEVLADGWWTRAFALGKFPPAILTNWASPLLAGDEPLDVAIDIVPQDMDYANWLLDVRINQMLTSQVTVQRMVALEQLKGLREAFERRRVAPFEVAMTVLVRGTSRQDVRTRSR